MDIGLQEFYRRIQLAPVITTFLPEEIGKGEITRISTNNGYQASSWDLVYACMLRPMSSGMFRVERKHRKECDRNREASWEFTLAFLREIWQT